MLILVGASILWSKSILGASGILRDSFGRVLEYADAIGERIYLANTIFKGVAALAGVAVILITLFLSRRQVATTVRTAVSNAYSRLKSRLRPTMPTTIISSIVSKLVLESIVLSSLLAFTSAWLLIKGGSGILAFLFLGFCAYGLLDALLKIRRVALGRYGDADFELRELVAPLVAKLNSHEGGDGDSDRLFPVRVHNHGAVFSSNEVEA